MYSIVKCYYLLTRRSLGPSVVSKIYVRATPLVEASHGAPNTMPSAPALLGVSNSVARSVAFVMATSLFKVPLKRSYRVRDNREGIEAKFGSSRRVSSISAEMHRRGASRKGLGQCRRMDRAQFLPPRAQRVRHYAE